MFGALTERALEPGSPRFCAVNPLTIETNRRVPRSGLTRRLYEARIGG